MNTSITGCGFSILFQCHCCKVDIQACFDCTSRSLSSSFTFLHSYILDLHIFIKSAKIRLQNPTMPATQEQNACFTSPKNQAQSYSPNKLTVGGKQEVFTFLIQSSVMLKIIWRYMVQSRLWKGEVCSYCNISPNIKNCFIHVKCTPRERTSNVPFERWVCLKKRQQQCCYWRVFILHVVNCHVHCYSVQSVNVNR